MVYLKLGFSFSLFMMAQSLFAKSEFMEFPKPLSVVCKEVSQNHPSRNQVLVLKENVLFPRSSGDHLSHFVEKCELKNQLSTHQLTGAAKAAFANQLQKNQSTLWTAQELQRKIKSITDQEMQKQKGKFKELKECALAMRKNQSLSSTCQTFRDKTIPQLNEKLKLMRQFLAFNLLNRGEFKDNAQMTHSFFVPGPKGKKTTADEAKPYQIAPLTEKELAELQKEFSVPEAVPKAEETYLALLSQSPILLFFKDSEIKIDELVEAFSREEELFSPLSEMDYFFVDPALVEAIKSMPPEKRAEACIVAHEIRENTKLSAKAGQFAMSVAGVPLMFKSLLWAGVEITTSIPSTSFLEANVAAQKMNLQLGLCFASSFAEKRNSICSFEGIQQEADTVKNSLLYVPIKGSPQKLKLLERK